METNYKVKHRRILMPLKLMLLLVAVALFGYTTYAQQGEAARVSNLQQLVEALDNPLVSYVVIDDSYQDFDRENVTRHLKAIGGNGSRNFTCAYIILDNDTCFFDPAQDPNGFVFNVAGAYSFPVPPTLPGQCPGDNDGYWLWNTTNPDIPPPPGASLVFTQALQEDTIIFKVDHAGVYTLRYNWGTPWNSYVQTEYKFYSPYVIQELSADDVCGLETYVDLEISSYYGDPNDTIIYTLWNECTGQMLTVPGPDLDTLWYFEHQGLPPYTIDNDTTQTEQFMITAPDYGNWKFIVDIFGGECDMVSDTIDIVFAIEPVADAGPNVEVCDDMCVTLIGSAGSMFYKMLPGTEFRLYMA
jgi:hypothetical protein